MSQPETSTATVVVDRISSLSNDILIHILSSLPTKQAFLTSILSKRWKHLWCYVPDLEFVEGELEKGKHSDSCLFNKFLYTVLRSREAAGNDSIRSFILHAKPKHFVQRIPLRLNFFEEFHKTILTCKTLVILKLNNLCMGCTPVRLPSLKTLHLKHIKFEYEDLLYYLLKGCPVLEDLQLYDLQLYDLSYVIIYYIKECCNILTKLKIADIIRCECVPMETLSNVEILRIQLYGVYVHYRFATFHNLTHLVLNYNLDLVLQVLHHCPKLQNLDLYQIQVDSFSDRKSLAHPKLVPECLSLNLTTCNMRDFRFAYMREYVMLARYILENSRGLETMSIWCSRKRSNKIERQLASCSWASATCKLSVYSEDIYDYLEFDVDDNSWLPLFRRMSESDR